jgi:antitoxin CptB
MDEARLKRIVFRAWRRGFREADLILGPFADKHVWSLTEAQVTALEALLEAPDLDLYDWILRRTPVPPEHDGEMLEMIRSFQVAQALEARNGG